MPTTATPDSQRFQQINAMKPCGMRDEISQIAQTARRQPSSLMLEMISNYMFGMLLCDFKRRDFTMVGADFGSSSIEYLIGQS